MASAAKDGEYPNSELSPKKSKDGDPKDVPTPARLEPAREGLLDAPSPAHGIEIEGDTSSFGAGEDEEGAHPSFAEPSANVQEDALAESLEERTHIMHRFILYETSTRFYLVGQDIAERHFRILKIDRTSPPGQLSIFEDANVYDRQSINELLITIEEGNKGSGGLKTRFNAWALLGFARFTDVYYMLLVTKRTQAAMLGGHYIYQVDATELIPLATGSSSRFQRDRNAEEVRYLGIFANVELNKSFYYSYSYNLTRTLQENMCRAKQALNEGLGYGVGELNDMFVWNHHLLEPAQEGLNNMYDWCVPLIHGYIEQASLDILGRRVFVTIIARRSRFFAGARYLKRGANDQGYVANDVETEQIVSDMMTTSFHAPGPRPFSSPSYTSYVQHRGSIPLHWSQDNSGVTPKPDIDMNLIDPFYSAAAMHFDDLFKRYGAPVYVLNLIKARERIPRESKLLQEFQKALAFLNQSLPDDKKILYKAFDMSRAAKTRGQDVIGVLEGIADEILEKTGFFQNGDYKTTPPKMQNGIARTNCIDCLDRTNAAQFVIGKKALGHQLHALGVISGDTVEYDSDAVNTFTHMFHSHGDTIAIQYGGSHLAHTMATYRKINEWKNHSRDVVESFKRYYHNSFLDSQRQEAYNLFLGNYKHDAGKPMLWDLASDHHLHNSDPRDFSQRAPSSYINWFTPAHLQPRVMPHCTRKFPRPRRAAPPSSSSSSSTQPATGPPPDDYWLEYYRPQALSTLVKNLAWKMAQRPRYLPEVAAADLALNPSPFAPRRPLAVTADHRMRDDGGARAGTGAHIRILPPGSGRLAVPEAGAGSSGARTPPTPHAPTAPPPTPAVGMAQSVATVEAAMPAAEAEPPPDRAAWTLKQWHAAALAPTVARAERDEYVAYLTYPLELPLVTHAAREAGALPRPERGARGERAGEDEDEADEDDGRHAELRAYVGRADAVVGGGVGTEVPEDVGAGLAVGGAGGWADDADGFDDADDEEAAEEKALRRLAGFGVDADAVADYVAFLALAREREPLTVRAGDGGRKRYKAYRQWLKGRSFFKLGKFDAEFQG